MSGGKDAHDGQNEQEGEDCFFHDGSGGWITLQFTMAPAADVTVSCVAYSTSMVTIEWIENALIVSFLLFRMLPAEGKGGQSFAVHQVGDRPLVPGETQPGGAGDLRMRDDHGVFLNDGLRGEEIAFFSGDLEVGNGVAVARGEAAVGVEEGNGDRVSMDLRGGEDRPAVIGKGHAMDTGQREPGEPLADGQFIGGMDVVTVGDIADERDSGFRQGERGGLGFPRLGERVRWDSAVVERSELDVVEGEISLIPECAPAFDEGAHFGVVVGLAHVGFPLIPDDAPDGVVDEGMNHAVEVDRGCESPVHRAGQGKFGIDAEFRLLKVAFARGPRLDGGRSPGRENQADGDSGFLMQLATEEITDGGKGIGCQPVGDVFRGTNPPRAAVDAFLWRGCGETVRETQADQGIISLGHRLFPVCRGGEAEFHVGLSRAEPHFAHQHVFQRDRFPVRDYGEGAALSRGGHRIERHLPASFRVRLRGLVLPGEGDGHLGSGFCGSPDRDGSFALENHGLAKSIGDVEPGTRGILHGKADRITQRGVFAIGKEPHPVVLPEAEGRGGKRHAAIGEISPAGRGAVGIEEKRGCFGTGGDSLRVDTDPVGGVAGAVGEGDSNGFARFVGGFVEGKGGAAHGDVAVGLDIGAPVKMGHQ